MEYHHQKIQGYVRTVSQTEHVRYVQEWAAEEVLQPEICEENQEK